jgi:hypothetical protein
VANAAVSYQECPLIPRGHLFSAHDYHHLPAHTSSRRFKPDAYKWQAPLQEVIFELDREKLGDKIQKLEDLIFEWILQLQLTSDSHREQEAINDALSTLRALKRDRLDNSDWK